MIPWKHLTVAVTAMLGSVTPALADSDNDQVETARGDTSQPHAFASALGCVVQPNPAYWNRADVRAALTASSNAIRAAALAEAASGTSEHAKAATSPLGPGKAALRFDAEGNVIVRVGFLVTSKSAVALNGYDAVVASAKKGLAATTAIYQKSNIKIAFEYAGDQLLAGEPEVYPNNVNGVSALLSAMSTLSTVPSASAQYGILEEVLRIKASLRANIMVGVASTGDVGGRTFLGSGAFTSATDGLMAIGLANEESLDTLVVSKHSLAHEIGHSIGQQHGPVTDLGLNPAPDLLVQYLSKTNYPFSNGYEALALGSTVNGVATMMTYNAVHVQNDSWYRATFPRFSDPTQSLTIGGLTLPLGIAERSDSVQAINRDRFNFAYGTTPGLQAWPVEVIEYYHAGLNQYFSTAVEDNIALLDGAGVAKTGWARTNNNYVAVSLNGDPSALLTKSTDAGYLAPVYRFYGDPSGPNTHFYTTFDASRAFVNNNVSNDVSVLRVAQINGLGNPHKLHIEGMEMRVAALSDFSALYGTKNQLSCDPSWTPVYRLFNNENGTRSRADGSKIDGNHRFAITQAIRTEMLGKGWVDEGVAWCVPPMR